MGSGLNLFVSSNNFLESWYGHLFVLELYCLGISTCKEFGRHMSVMTEERQQIQLELEGLKRTLEWTEIQREQLLDRLDMLRLDNARLQDRVEELVRQVEGLKQQQPMF